MTKTYKQTQKNKTNKRLILIKKAELRKKKKVRTIKICKTCVRTTRACNRKKKGICKIYYLWVAVIASDICQILQEKPNGKLKIVLFRMKK